MDKNTTFDEVYEVFMSLVCGVDEDLLPQTQREMISLISLSVMTFNRKREGSEIGMDKDLEVFIPVNDNEKTLSENEILLLAYCMRLQIYKNMLQELVSMLSVSTKDASLKDYKGQVNSRRQMVVDEEQLINQQALFMSAQFEVER